MAFHDLLSCTDLAAWSVQCARAASKKAGMEQLAAWMNREGMLLRKWSVVLRQDGDTLHASGVRLHA